MPAVVSSFHRRVNTRRLLLCVAVAVLGGLLLPVAASAASATASKPKVLANGTLRVTVTAPGAGTAEISAVRVTTSSPVGLLCATATTFSTAGESQTLLCKPTATAQKIGRNGAYRLRPTLTFTAADGAATTTSLGVVVVPRLPNPTAAGSDVKQLDDGSISVLISSTGPGTAVVTGTNDPGLMCTGRAKLATQGSATVTCALTSFGVFLHKAGNMFVDVSLQFTPAGGRTTTTAVGRLLMPIA
jgi:hypothetical protein